MINSNYIELIHKDIDRTIAQFEKQKLDEYLETNSEAKELYMELLRTESLLDKLPDIDPSANLKKRIMNSIDYNRYSNKNKKFSFSEYIGRFISASPRKIATSFALVLIIGSIILLSINLIPNLTSNLDDQNVYGTIGVHKTEIQEIIKIDADNILGDIQINKESNLYKFKIDLNSVNKYNLQIEFDPTNVSIDNYQSNSNAIISEDKSSIIFSNSSKLVNEIVFNSKNMSKDVFSIKLFNDDNYIFERNVVITK